MLPDFFELKLTLARHFEALIHLEAYDDPLLTLPKKHRLHEGASWTIVRSDGTAHHSEFRTAEATIEITAEDIETRGMELLAEARSTLASQFASKMSADMIQSIEDATKESGNVVKGSGRITASTVLEAFRTMQLDFDDNGEWVRPQFVIPPSKRDELEQALETLHTDPAYSEQLADVLAEQKRAWRVREDSRKLVD